MEARIVSMLLGIVVERRAPKNAWADDAWIPVSVVAGTPIGGEWAKMVEGEGWTRYFAGTLTLELHHKETEGYVFNLQSRHPAIYVVLRSDDAGPMPVRPHLVTASPHEADGHLQSDEETVEKVAMPPEVRLWIEAFVERHHVHKPFIKRQKNRIRKEDHLFGKDPIFRPPPSGQDEGGA